VSAPEGIPADGTSAALRWLRRNLFRSPVDALITIVSGLVVGYLLYRALRFVFVTGRWDIVRVNLSRFMIGNYPRDELWRIVIIVLAVACFLGLALGNGTKRLRLEHGPPTPVRWTRRARDLGVRLWPLILGALLLLAMAETVLPWLLVVAIVATSAVSMLIGERIPDRVIVWTLFGATIVGALLVWVPNEPVKAVLVAIVAAATVAGGLRLAQPPAVVAWVLLGGASGLIALRADLSTWMKVVVLGLVGLLTVAAVLRMHQLPVSVPFWLVLGGLVLTISAVRLLTRPVGWDGWGGLMMNLFLAIAGISLCFPLGVLLALGRQAGNPTSSVTGGIITALVLGGIPLAVAIVRGINFGDSLTVTLLIAAAGFAAFGFFAGQRSTLPLLRAVSVGYIELIRGMPLYVLLLISFAALVFFFPEDFNTPGLVVRAIVVFTLFTAAYVAEIVRGGLQSLPKGQTEAAQALGLSPVKTTFLIVLPQALRNVIPALVGQFISLFKDTTLAGAAMGFGDMLNIGEAIRSQDAFAGARLIPETTTFVMLVFWVGCITMSRESQRLERKLGVGTR